MGIKAKVPIGEVFGKLTILEEVEHTYHPSGKMNRKVKVACGCGSITVKSLQTVKSGKQNACGLCRVGLVKDLSGMRVNHLNVTGEYHGIDGKIHWKCICDCGRSKFFSIPQIVNARVYNCGECGTAMGTYYWGDKVSNFEGYEFTLISIENKIATLEDSSGRRFDISYGHLKNGIFCYPYHPSVAGVGPYVSKRGERHTEEYENWSSMVKRCYAQKERSSSYLDKSVCSEWHNFQTFAEWATRQVGFDKENCHLDKDLLVKYNKIYSPETCAYIPREINTFIRRYRVNDLPLGVDKTFRYNGDACYRAQARESGKNINLGFYDTPEEAFSAYKKHKEALAKTLAEKWKDSIDPRAYESLMNYKVEITD